jgi:hypothetical protein
VLVGGYWRNGRICGPVCFYCNAAPGFSGVDRLARLFVAVKTGV